MPIEVKAKGGGVVRVWVAMSYSGLTKLHFYDGNLNADAYSSILAKAKRELKEVAQGGYYKFVQDGARAHTAAKTQRWIQENFEDFLPRTSGLPTRLTSTPSRISGPY